MTVDHARALVTRYFEEVWNRGRLDALDEILTADYVNHSPSLPDPQPGPAGLKVMSTGAGSVSGRIGCIIRMPRC
jgi:SnoaL-like polyketide cyclase